MTYDQESRLRKRVLEMATQPECRMYRRELRQIFYLLDQQHYNVAGYKAQLERALGVVNKAMVAINALEN